MVILHKDDFYLVAKVFRPDITYEEFEEMWEDFLKEREKHYKEKELN